MFFLFFVDFFSTRCLCWHYFFVCNRCRCVYFYMLLVCPHFSYYNDWLFNGEHLIMFPLKFEELHWKSGNCVCSCVVFVVFFLLRLLYILWSLFLCWVILIGAFLLVIEGFCLWGHACVVLSKILWDLEAVWRRLSVGSSFYLMVSCLFTVWYPKVVVGHLLYRGDLYHRSPFSKFAFFSDFKKWQMIRRLPCA